MWICENFRQNRTSDVGLLTSIQELSHLVTMDKTVYEQEIKQQTMEWRQVLRSKENLVEKLLLQFFGQVITIIDFLVEGKTLTVNYYSKLLITLLEKIIQRRRRKLSRGGMQELSFRFFGKAIKSCWHTRMTLEFHTSYFRCSWPPIFRFITVIIINKINILLFFPCFCYEDDYSPFPDCSWYTISKLL